MKVILSNSSLVFSEQKVYTVKTTGNQNWFNLGKISSGKYRISIVSSEKQWNGNAICGFTNDGSTPSVDPFRAKFLYVTSSSASFDITLNDEFNYVYTYTPDSDNNITFKIEKIG